MTGGATEYVFYAAAKGGIDALTNGLAREVAKEGIRVNAIRPGPTETEIHEPGRLARIAPLLPMGRPGQPDEIAEAVLFLLSDAASYVSGAVLNVSGGKSCAKALSATAQVQCSFRPLPKSKRMPRRRAARTSGRIRPESS